MAIIGELILMLSPNYLADVDEGLDVINGTPVIPCVFGIHIAAWPPVEFVHSSSRRHSAHCFDVKLLYPRTDPAFAIFDCPAD